MKDYDDVKRTGDGMPARARKKARVTMYLDPAIVEAFRRLATKRGSGYQTLINEVLRQTIHPDLAPLTVESLRTVLREELSRHCANQPVADRK